MASGHRHLVVTPCASEPVRRAREEDDSRLSNALAGSLGVSVGVPCVRALIRPQPCLISREGDCGVAVTLLLGAALAANSSCA
jgi:hypothetical protein